MSPAARRRRAPVAAAPLEIEAKLLVPQTEDLDRIARLTQLGAYRLQRRRTARLHSLYLDTPERRLTRQGLALRLRRRGTRWEATLKWPGRVRGTVHTRPELTVPLVGTPPMPFVPPVGPLRAHLAARVTGRPFAPILITQIHRRLFNVLPPGQRSDDPTLPIAELALDRVRLTAPGHRRHHLTYCEVEIELAHGSRRDLAALTVWLRRRFRLKPSTESKFARGLAFLDTVERREANDDRFHQ